MSKPTRHPAALILRAAGALIALLSVTVIAGRAAAAPVPDAVVSGTVTPALAGQVITISMGGTPCTTVLGGTTLADGTYQIQVNCPDMGTATLVVNGTPTGTPFAYFPGTVHTGVNAVVSGGESAATQQTFVFDATTRLFCFPYTGPTTVASTGFASRFVTAINVASVIRPNGTWMSWLRSLTPSTDFTISTGTWICVSGPTASGGNVFN